MSSVNETARRIYKSLGRNYTIEAYLTALNEGMLPIGLLKHDVTYAGHCRNADKAVWDENIKKFIYVRYKFQSEFLEAIPHPYDDEGFDIFVPVAEVTNESDSHHPGS